MEYTRHRRLRTHVRFNVFQDIPMNDAEEHWLQQVQSLIVSYTCSMFITTTE